MTASPLLLILAHGLLASRDSGLFVSILVAVLAAYATSILYGWWWERKRTAALRKLAEEMALEFHEAGELHQAGSVAAFQLFTKGHSRSLTNLLLGPGQQVTMAAFDYRYSTGSGKNKRTYTQTVISFRSESLFLPKFILRPENLLDKIGKLVGFRDIDFPEYPEFSSRFLLRGDIEAQVRKLFTEEIVLYFRNHEPLCVEGWNNQLILFRANRRPDPAELKKMIAESYELFRLLSAER